MHMYSTIPHMLSVAWCSTIYGDWLYNYQIPACQRVVYPCIIKSATQCMEHHGEPAA